MCRATSSFLVFTVASLAAIVMQTGCEPCAPAIVLDPPAIRVIDNSSGAPVYLAEATLTGADARKIVLVCESVANAQTTMCSWPKGEPIIAGTYTLTISAPGYQPATISVTMMVANNCGGKVTGLQPGTVALDPL
jgi:hypothetical protein